MALFVYFAMTWIAGGPGSVAVRFNFGANFRPLLAAGDLWRLVASVFVHSGLLHLTLGAYGVLFLGRNLEAFYGPWTLGALFVVSGAGASLASALASPQVSFGASGALFGLVAACLVFAYRHYALLPAKLPGTLALALAPWLVFHLIPGWVVPRVDLAGYVGGFVTGALVAWFVRPEALVEASGLVPRPPRLLVSFAASLLIVSFVSAGANIFRMRDEHGPLMDARIVEALGQVDRAEALRAVEEGMARNPNDVSLLLARATVRTMASQWNEAVSDYRAVLAVNPDDARALNNLAWLLLEEVPEHLRDRTEATELAWRAVEAAPDDPYSAGTYGTALLRGGDAAGAREQLARALATPRPPVAEATDRYLLAVALSALGRSEEAAVELREAVRQDPDSGYRGEAESAVGVVGGSDAQKEPAS